MHTWVLFIVILITPLESMSDMHKCRNKNGTVIYSDVGCSQGDILISVNGVSAEEIKRLELEKRRIAAEKIQADAAAAKIREQARLKALALEYQQQLEASSEYATESHQKQKWLQTGNYSDYPERIRYYNPNTDSKCREIVSRMRALENDPQWERDASIQRRWSNLVTIASNNKCKH